MPEKKDRNFIANWENWPFNLDEYAREHAKESYFEVDGYDDRFLAFRSALWMNKGQRRSILTGVTWREGWLEAKDGIIPKEQTRKIMGHSLKIYGQKNIAGELYLMAQLSNGSEVGNNGIFYFPKEVINRDFTFGAKLFKDMPPDEAKKICWPWWIIYFEAIKKFIINLIK